jgi:hypothetical protein
MTSPSHVDTVLVLNFNDINKSHAGLVGPTIAWQADTYRELAKKGIL